MSLANANQLLVIKTNKVNQRYNQRLIERFFAVQFILGF